MLKIAEKYDMIVKKVVQYGKVDMQIIVVEIWSSRWN